jgi:pyrroline-5-carboxylate reductase
LSDFYTQKKHIGISLLNRGNYMKKNIIGIIGGGNMGEALIKGLYARNCVHVCETNASRTKYLKNKYRGIVLGDLKVVKDAAVIILAVKPQDMESLLKQIPVGKNKLFISIAAGLTTKFFEKHLGGKVRVVRAMPNMPAFIAEGITGICGGHFAESADLKLACTILSAIGETVIVKESMIDAVTAVSGSGPAYVFLFVEQWINAAVKLGFDKVQATQLVYKTLLGSAHLLEQSKFDAGELRTKVTSKGGTTQAAMDVFSKGKFDQLIYKALLAAKKRAKELAK